MKSTELDDFLDDYMAQLSPEIFDPRKVDTNFLEADFEYFRVLEARGDV